MRSHNILLVNPPASRYGLRQRLLSGSLGLAMTGSFCATGALAHEGWSTFVPVTAHNSSATSLPNLPSAAGSFAFPASHILHQTVIPSSTYATSAGTVVNAWRNSTSSAPSLVGTALAGNDLELNNNTAMFSAGSLAGFHNITIDIGGKQEQISFGTQLTAAELVAAQQVLSGGTQDITINTKGIATGGYFDLNNTTVAALDSAVGGSIGALDISHGVVAIDTLSNLSLVGSLVNLGTIDVGAASGSKGQTTDTISAANIYNEAGGVIASAAGVSGVTSTGLSLTTTGAFINNGTVSSSSNLNIAAASISNVATNAGTGTATHASSVMSAVDNVNLSTTALTNSGTISATTGNVNIANGGGNADIAVTGTGGTVQALKGDINFNGVGYTGSGNVTVNGGNWLSQQFDVNDGSGANNVSVGELTGIVNVTAGSSHVTADTSNLQLGTSNISGDPTYYNAGGNVTIDTGVIATGGADLAIVASGNIIGNGGTLDTSSTSGGGALTLIAGANFTPTSGSGLPDPNNTLITISDSSTSGKGSTTGGYIDLSGVTLTGVTTNTPVVAVTTAGTGAGPTAAGNILMVAYKGSGTNSGSIVATATTKQTSGATTIDAIGSGADGTVTLIGGGSQITAQNINAGAVTIEAGTPSISGGTFTTSGIEILNGSIQAGSGTYGISGSPSSTAINLTSISSSGNVAISTAGKIAVATIAAPAGNVSLFEGATSGTALLPININAAQLSLSSTRSGASFYVQSTGASLILDASSLLGGATLSVNAGGTLNPAGTLEVAGSVSAGTLNTTTGNITGGIVSLTSGGTLTVDSGNLISGTTVNLTTTGAGSTNAITTSGTALISATNTVLTTNTGNITANTAVGTLTVKSGASSVSIVESGVTPTSTAALALLASTIGAGGAFTLASTQPINVNGVLTASNGTVTLIESGTTTDTTNGTTSVAGISIGAAINVGGASGGTVNLTTSGNENIVERSGTLTASAINIVAAAAVGTSGTPFATDTPTLSVNGSSINPIYIKDLGTVAFTVGGTSIPGESISINSKAAAFTVDELIYTNVTLTDTAVGGNTNINSTAVINGVSNSSGTVGDGTGTVTVTTAGSINQQTGSLFGDFVTLTSSAGGIGASGAPISVNTPELTANAVKGSVYINGLQAMSLNAGTALSTYDVTGTSLAIDGTIKTTTSLTGSILLSADSITQALSTAYLSGANISLSNNVLGATGGTIGQSTGFQSIQTRAVNSLSITDNSDDTTAFSAFVTQTGTIILGAGSSMTGGSDSGGAGSSLNLALASGNKLTVDTSIAGFTNVAITAPASLTVTTGEISTTNLTINSPSVILSNSGSIVIVAPVIPLGGTGTASLSFASTTGLSITGTGSITLPPSATGLSLDLSLSGQTSITIGSGTGGLVNPLGSFGGTAGAAGPLNNLTIFTAGVFTGNYGQFILASGSNDSLSVTASSLKNSGGNSEGPFVLEANGSNSSSVNLDLTGSQAVTISDSPTTTPVAQPYFSIIAGSEGGSVGSVSVSSGGTLTVVTSGLNVPLSSNDNSIALSGRTLVTTNLSGSEFDGSIFSSVSLGATSGTFTVGTTATTPNGFAGSIDATYVNIAGPTVVINNNSIIEGAQISFDTSNFKFTSGSIVGEALESPFYTSLSISNFSTGGLTISPALTESGGIYSYTGGTFSGISSLLLQSASGGINVGALFTNANLMGEGSGITNIAISAVGTVTLPTTLQTMVVVPAGVNPLAGSTPPPSLSIYVNATSLSYTPSTKNTVNYLTFEADGGSVTLQLNSSIILGQARGDYNINVNNDGVSPGTGSYSVASNGTLKVSEVLNTLNGDLSGTTIALSSNVTTASVMQISSTGTATNGITEATGVLISTGSAGQLIVGENNLSLPTAVNALNISTDNLVVVSGALLLNNSYGGNVAVSQQINNLTSTLSALTLTNSSGLSGTGSTLTVNTILTANGGIDIVNSNGGIVVNSNSYLETTKGNITLQNNDLTGTIQIGSDVTIYGSGTGGTVGQVSIVIGPVPTTTMSAGQQPANLPIITASGSGHVYYTTTANPRASITSDGLNFLNASGRNIVFNANGNNSAITLDGGDSITADPPAVSAAASGGLGNAGGGMGAAGFASVVSNASPFSGAPLGTTLNGQNQGISLNASSQMSAVNWSLPTTAVINSSLQDAIAGTITPSAGSIVSNTDSVIPVTGTLAPGSDTIALSAGTLAPDSDTIAPSAGTLALGSNTIVPGSNTIAPCAVNGLLSRSASGMSQQATGGAKLSGGSKLLSGGVSNSDVETFESGALLLSPKTQKTLNTGFGSVDVAAGSVVMVMRFDGGLAVYNLHDTKNGAVQVRVGGNTIKLSPGQNAVLTDKKIHCFEEINPVQTVAYRHMVAKELGKGMQGFQSEFNILSMLQSCGALRDMVRAQDAGTRKAVDSILKTSAILMQLSGSQYEYMTTPAVTAMVAR